MPDTYTARYNLTVPEPNGSRDTWGQKTNQNWSVIDNALYLNSKAISDLDAAVTQRLQTQSAAVNTAVAGKLDANQLLINAADRAAIARVGSAAIVAGTYVGAVDGNGDFFVPFPTPFTARPVVIAINSEPTLAGTGNWIMNVGSTSTNGFVLRIRTPIDTNPLPPSPGMLVRINFIAIGSVA